MFFKKPLALCTDEVLMGKLSEGNPAALEELYQRYSIPLLRYFTRMLGNDKNKGEDFLHDLFVKLIDRPEQFDQQGKFKTWMYSIANNMCKNEYRRLSYRQTIKDQYYDVAEESDPIRLDHSLFTKRLDDLIKQLSEDDRNLFLLRYTQELEISEISAVLDCPEGTIKSRLFYLRKWIGKNVEDFKILLEKN